MGCRGEGGGETLSQFRVTHCREERRGEIRLYEDLETTRERGDDLQIENDHSIYRRVYLQFKSFLSSSLYIYIYTPRSSPQCVCDYRSRRGDFFLSAASEN